MTAEFYFGISTRHFLPATMFSVFLVDEFGKVTVQRVASSDGKQVVSNVESPGSIFIHQSSPSASSSPATTSNRPQQTVSGIKAKNGAVVIQQFM